MENKKRVLIGMSGGVDSSVAALLLQKQGYDVVGCTMRLWDDPNQISGCSNTNAISDAKTICDKLGIEHHVIDFREEFKNHVIENFICEYRECRTPNPCIECNKHMKFDLMFKKANELGCDYIATGHYAKTEYSDEYNRYVIRKSNSDKKDQSYVLYNIPKDKVEFVLFPLSDFTSKDEIRKIANDNDLINANRPDSQDICFVPDGDYISFLKNNSDIKSKEGNIVTTDGKVLGKHKGLISYTIGQRKGLGIGGGTVYYVIKLDKEKNELVVGSEKEVMSKTCIATSINIILYDDIKDDLHVNAKIRYNSKPIGASIKMIDNNEILVTFDDEAKSVTPGQSIVFYTDDGIIIGGGIIK
ncbi:MAG: tRNA 2-thiouridine(34) synthase MnmA [Clostridia bacterium]|nr:tRNA 2-thiouridine(34) synthase MnmA [Clostridia bacterium]